MKFPKIALAMLAATIVSAGAASAVPVSFYLGKTASYGPDCGIVDTGAKPHVARCSSDGVALDIFGYEYDPATGKANLDNQLDLDQGHALSIGHNVDNYGTDEALFLQFGETVTLTSLTFGKVDSNDEVHIGVLESIGVAATPFYYADIPGHGYSSLDLTGTRDLSGSLFVVGTSIDDCFNRHGKDKCADNDNWTLKYVTVDVDPNQNIPPVPLPAAGWMLLAGLGGLAAARRRKRAS